MLPYIFLGHKHATVIGMDMRGFGHWLSSNEKIVHINQITGEAQARSEGVAEGSLHMPKYNCIIHYQLDSVLFFHDNFSQIYSF